MTMSQPAKYYERFSRLPFEEDMTHEFKGHRNLCMEEIPSWALVKDEHGRPSRKPVSRNLCGFLNTGKGGTVYCGVVDDGVVHGLALTHFQREHIVGSVQDLMNRFTPPVPSYRYKVRFVPVFGTSVSEQQRKEMLAFKTREHIDPELKKLKHTFRNSQYCWCDQENLARYKNGTLSSEYVVEVTILPWDPDKKENKGLGHFLNLHPIYACEQGFIYFRQSASLQQYTLQEVTRMTFYEVDKRKNEVISRLKKQIAELELAKKKKQQTKQNSMQTKALPSPSSVLSLASGVKNAQAPDLPGFESFKEKSQSKPFEERDATQTKSQPSTSALLSVSSLSSLSLSGEGNTQLPPNPLASMLESLKKKNQSKLDNRHDTSLMKPTPLSPASFTSSSLSSSSSSSIDVENAPTQPDLSGQEWFKKKNQSQSRDMEDSAQPPSPTSSSSSSSSSSSLLSLSSGAKNTQLPSNLLASSLFSLTSR